MIFVVQSCLRCLTHTLPLQMWDFSRSALSGLNSIIDSFAYFLDQASIGRRIIEALALTLAGACSAVEESHTSWNVFIRALVGFRGSRNALKP